MDRSPEHPGVDPIFLAAELEHYQREHGAEERGERCGSPGDVRRFDGEKDGVCELAVLSRGPRLLLIDELSFGLAPRVLQRLMKAVREAADSGAAVVIVEQFARLALEIADRAYVLVNGRVDDEGTTEELRQNLGEIERKYLGVD